MICLDPHACARNAECLHRDHCFPPRNEITTAVNPKELQATADSKAPLQYLDPVMDEDIAYVMEHGALKYGLRNYRDTPMKASVYVGAMRRHLKAWATGEDLDPDSGRPHLAHLVACAVVIEAAREAGTYVDDRTVKASTPLSDLVHIDGDQQAKGEAPIKYNTAACKYASSVTCNELSCNPCSGCRS